MLKKILIISSVVIQLFSTSLIFDFTEAKQLNPSANFTEVCYSEIIIIEGKQYLYEYACDGTLIRVTEIPER